MSHLSRTFPFLFHFPSRRTQPFAISTPIHYHNTSIHQTPITTLNHKKLHTYLHRKSLNSLTHLSPPLRRRRLRHLPRPLLTPSPPPPRRVIRKGPPLLHDIHIIGHIGRSPPRREPRRRREMLLPPIRRHVGARSRPRPWMRRRDDDLGLFVVYVAVPVMGCASYGAGSREHGVLGVVDGDRVEGGALAVEGRVAGW